ncbi:MAG: PAS domain S-box protein [Bacteroidales bacterium]|nr:PAS domain S-box protein [Bacteroidales bacterium]
MKQPDYKSLIYHSPLAYAYLEAIVNKKGITIDFRFLEVNSRFEKITGSNEEYIVGRTVKDTLPEYIKPTVDLSMYGKIAFEGGSDIRELYFKATGNWYRVLAYSNEKGFLATLIEDITEGKQAVEKMKASEENFRLLFENLVEGIYRTTPDGRIIDANPALVRLLGFPDRESLLKTNVNDLYYERKDRNKEFQLLDKKNVILSNEIRLRRYDGKIIWAADSFRTIRDDNNTVKYFEGTIIDITEKKEAEEALYKSEERYKNFISQVSDAVYRFEFTDPIPINMPIEEQIDCIYERTHLAECNPAFLRMYNIDDEADIIGKTILDFYGTKDNPQNRYVTGQFIKSGYKTENNITEEIDSRGNRKYINNNTLGIVKDGYLMRIWGTQTDITEQKNSENELILAKQKAEESNRLKTHFLANMSHEIRTPMNSIIGFVELLQKLDLTSEEKENFISTMQESGQRLLDTINNIIEMSKIETENIRPVFSETHIPEITDYLSGLFKPQTDEKGLKLIINNDTKIGQLKVLTDRNLLISILSNLLKNAVKFTQKGIIELGNLVENDSLIFFIRDSGIGIPIDHQEIIFDRFVQADLALSRPYEGSGLGLSIAKSYTEILGGKIWFESKEREGSTFYLSIPYKREMEHSTVKKNEAAMNEKKYEIKPGLNVLIAEDDDANFLYLEKVLINIGAKVTRTTNGYDTVEKVREDPEVNLVLMDVKMPEINGWDATRSIREFNKDIPIIATTAYALTGDREKSLEAGCNDYLAKPIRKDDLLRIISKNFYR